MSKPKIVSMREVHYATNQIMQAGDRFYFVKKAKLIGEGMYQVVGAKVDVTESVQALIDKRERAWRASARKKKVQQHV